MKKIKAFTLAEVLMAKRMRGKECLHSISRVSEPKEPSKNINKLTAFTLAEVLITLAIIGVVAALTIPTLITNYKKNLYVTQLKKEYNAITNAFHMAMGREGVTKLTDTALWSKIPQNSTQAQEADIRNNQELKEEFFKIFNIIEIPNATSFSYKTLDGRTPGYYRFNQSFCFADGACIGNISLRKNVGTASCDANRNPCSSLIQFQKYYNSPTKLWQNAGFIYIDVNGPREPNQFGRDLFQFTIGNDGNLYPSGGVDTAVIATIYNNNNYGRVLDNTNPDYWRYNNNYGCNPSNTSSAGGGCAARIMEEGWKMNY